MHEVPSPLYAYQVLLDIAEILASKVSDNDETLATHKSPLHEHRAVFDSGLSETD